MADLVEQVLQKAAEKESKYKTIEVEKSIDLDIDEGNLLAVDQNPIDSKSFKYVGIYGSFRPLVVSVPVLTLYIC